jgi:branched-chain amino acid transport system substrate-binding protein
VVGDTTSSPAGALTAAEQLVDAGVNGVYAPIDPNTAFALVTALRQLGAKVKVALFPTGYGGDLTQAGPNASQVAQGVHFTVGLLVQALKGAGSQPTSSSLLTALSNIHDWNYLGLWGGKTLDINNRNDTQNVDGPGNCTCVVKYTGTSFHLASGADPICGPVIPGLNETAG